MLNILHLRQTPILEQLKIEEALLRSNQENWCLINRGSPPAIVMGISAIPEQVVDFEKLEKRPIPLIRRYSGGGTVVVEPTTIFVTWILNHNMVPVQPYPRELLAWTETLYKPVFKNLPFALRENDYVLGERKCGGNAQYLAKGRIVHHTSFLWDYSDEHMDLLRMPPKMPAYRAQRSHQDFLTPLKDHFESADVFVKAMMEEWERRFTLRSGSLSIAEQCLNLPHRKATKELELQKK